MTKHLGPRIAKLNKAIVDHDLEKAAQELDAGGSKRCLVVRVREGETEQEAYTRTLDMHPEIGELSPAALERLPIIVVHRVAKALAETLSV